MNATWLTSFITGLWRLLAVASFVSVLWTCSAAADGLFKLLPGAQTGIAAAQKTPGLGVKRSRDVAIDLAYLAAKVAPLGIDNVAGRVDRAPPAGTVRIELFKGFTASLKRTSISEAFGGGFIWTGQSRGADGASANLVIRNGRVSGLVNFGAYIYRIDPLGVGDAHRISEVDGGAFPGDEELQVPTPRRGATPRQDHGAADTPNEITVLIAHTARVQSAVVDVQAQANLAISRANSAFEASNVALSYRLVGVPLVSGYDEQAPGASFNSVLDDLTNGTAAGPFQPIHAARDALGADLVSLLIDRSEFCGLAWAPTNPAPQTANFGMSVVAYRCITNESFAHETGHNLGLVHDRHVEAAAPNTQYNFGFVSLPGQFRDIMAYNDLCRAQTTPFNCQRINGFSNPGVSFNGFATGVAAGTDGAADNARRLGETKAAVAAYRMSPAPTTSIVAAVTPVARATAIGGTVTAFATILNATAVNATSCSIAMPAGFAVNFVYSARNITTLVPENPGVPVDIAGNGGRQFIMSFTPTAALTANIPLIFDCTNSPPAPTFVGLNTFLLTSAATAPADLLSIAVTPSQDGIIRVPLGGVNIAALAAQNIGAAATLQARLAVNPIDVTGGSLPATFDMCQTDPTTGQCITARAATIDFNAPANQMVTFTAFLTSNGTPIAFDPANKRLYIHFFQGATPVGSASVAVQTVTPDASVTTAAAN